jgi:hypothetical protein
MPITDMVILGEERAWAMVLRSFSRYREIKSPNPASAYILLSPHEKTLQRPFSKPWGM